MKRVIYSELIRWKQDPLKKPLLLQGARQVGKTYIIDQFGKNEYSNFITLNFEQNPDLRSLFNNELEPEKIISNISLYLGKKIEAQDTLLFFDEIQIAPKVLTSLKYFQEKAPDFQIIAAGSLLGVSVGKQTSFPVGKVNFMTLRPMSFIEYLNAFEEELTAETLLHKTDLQPFPEVIHKKLLEHIRLYLFLGGMPEVLQSYHNNKDIHTVRKIQSEILEAYQRDFSKYTKAPQAMKISELWNSVPYQLAKENKKFKYKDIKKNARSSTYQQTIEWLHKAGLINVVYNLKKPKLPMGGYVDSAKFKIYLLDTGLLGAMLKLSSDLIIKPTEIFSEYNGAFIESFVASELINSGFEDICYWTSKSSAEVDFVFQKDNEIIPLEVKSGLSRNLKSLRSYEKKYDPKYIYRCSPRNFIKQDNFVNLPLYAIEFLRSL